MKIYCTQTHTPLGGAVKKYFFSLLNIKESKMKLVLVVIDSLGKQWLRGSRNIRVINISKHDDGITDDCTLSLSVQNVYQLTFFQPNS